MTTNSPPAARLAQLEAFLRHDPDNAGLLNEAFGAALHASMFDAAEFHCVHAMRIGHDAAQWGLNAVHLDLGRHCWDAASERATILREAPGTRPELLDALDHALAYARFRQGRWDEALRVIEPMLTRADATGAPLAPATQALALRLWHRLDQHERGMAWARARFDASTLAPEASGVASLMALDAGDFAASDRWMRASLAAGASCAESWVSASSLATAHRDAASAQRFARQALALIPDDGRSWSALGLAQMLAGDLASARTSFEAALRTMPDHVGTWLSLGWVALLTADDAGSLAAFEQAVVLDRNFGESHGALASIQAKLGQRDAALASVERARRLDPAGLSFHYAQRLLDGGDPNADGGLLPLARHLLGERQAPSGGTMADWLPPA